MKILITGSKSMAHYVGDIQRILSASGHTIFLTSSQMDPWAEGMHRGTKEHAAWKAKILKHNQSIVERVDCLLVLNFNKDDIENYIGGTTFLDMYLAFQSGKPIYLMRDIPEGILKDEIISFNPVILHEDLSKIDSNE